MRWIKPIIRRRAGQTKAHATITLTSADTANKIIRDGIDICGARARAERVKQEPLQCLKCRGWEHKAESCEAQADICGTCGDSHRTGACVNKNKLFCVSCQNDTHASWDRTCPEFRRRCAIYDERYPENNMVYFPTDQDWTLTSKPNRIPLEERFPARFAVNSLPVTANRRHHRPVVRLPMGNHSGRRNPPSPQGQRNTERHQRSGGSEAEGFLARSQPNLVLLGRGREEGELSNQADLDSFLDHQDNIFVERTLGSPDWRANHPSGSWDQWNA